MSNAFLHELEDRFLRYVKIDTTADPTSTTSPSTAVQFDLLNLLVEELKQIGVQDVSLTDYGALLATIPATVPADVPTIALLAHVDTAPQFSGTNVKPIVHRHYSGADIVLPDNPSQVLSPKELPYLTEKIGDDIVTASGTTLLGADDKAGIAIIMAVARHLLQNPDLPHGPIRISAMGLTKGSPSRWQLRKMRAMVEQAMKDGAVGLSTGLIYPPGMYSDFAELKSLARVVAHHDGVYTSHIRGSSELLIQAHAAAWQPFRLLPQLLLQLDLTLLGVALPAAEVLAGL